VYVSCFGLMCAMTIKACVLNPLAMFQSRPWATFTLVRRRTEERACERIQLLRDNVRYRLKLRMRLGHHRATFILVGERTESEANDLLLRE
jgi:hypothetical protein